MIRKSILPIILAILFLSCDSDFKQGNCDEGFFEQTNGNGGTHCVPITEEGVVYDSEFDGT